MGLTLLQGWARALWLESLWACEHGLVYSTGLLFRLSVALTGLRYRSLTYFFGPFIPLVLWERPPSP